MPSNVAKNTIDRYKVEAIQPILLRSLNRYVTFTTPDAARLPVPKREYLELHATCAKVAHLSGAAEYVDRILEDTEDVRVLSSDGGSAEILEHALLSASPRAVPV